MIVVKLRPMFNNTILYVLVALIMVEFGVFILIAGPSLTEYLCGKWFWGKEKMKKLHISGSWQIDLAIKHNKIKWICWTWLCYVCKFEMGMLEWQEGAKDWVMRLHPPQPLISIEAVEAAGRLLKQPPDRTLCQLTVWPLSNQRETGCRLISLNANLQGLDIHGLFSKETVSIKIDFFLSQSHSGNEWSWST